MQVANLSNINRSNIDKLIQKLRCRIYELNTQERLFFNGASSKNFRYFSSFYKLERLRLSL